MFSLFKNNHTLENNALNTILLKVGILISIVCYFFIGYYTQRTDIFQLFSYVTVLFAIYFYVVLKPDLVNKNFNLLLIAAFLFRILFIFASPALSDDYFRFIWDGRLSEIGINPFLYLPSEVHSHSLLKGEMNDILIQKMNSPNYYSVYPPVLQYIFYIGSKLSFSNNYTAIIVLRTIIFMAEIGTCIYISKILKVLNLPKNKLFIYLLNPLVIIEISGNLHFEGIMLFFIVASIYYLLKNNFIYSSVFFSLSVCTKMIPLVLLPLIIRKIGFKNGVIYSFTVFILTIILFLPFLNNELISHIGNSVGLYFQKFEFNASIYYLARWIGYQLSGYNEIAIIGKLLPIVSFVLILLISYSFKPNQSEESFFDKIVSILFVYYLFSLIIHPWYTTFLVLISVFLNKRFALIWSFLIFGTYLSYAFIPFKENSLVLFFEYGIVLTWFFMDKTNLKLT